MKIKIGLVGLLVLILIQFIPFERNKSADSLPNLELKETANGEPLDVNLILQTSCFNCHSNNTSYPWYSKVSPISWYLENHIRGGKKKLNFSAWESYSEEDNKHLSMEIVEVIEDQYMPLGSYTLIHSEAKLSEENKALLIQYFKLP
ncbi:MAG: hypothetical protein ACI9O4_000484 [Chitinophagales bacterium]|jgi:hypothetical protein